MSRVAYEVSLDLEVPESPEFEVRKLTVVVDLDAIAATNELIPGARAKTVALQLACAELLREGFTGWWTLRNIVRLPEFIYPPPDT